MLNPFAAVIEAARRRFLGIEPPAEDPPLTEFAPTVPQAHETAQPDISPQLRRDGVWLGFPFVDEKGEPRQNRMPVVVLWRGHEWSCVQRVSAERPFVIPTADLLLT